MQLKKEFQICTIAGKDFLIPIGTAVVDMQNMIDLNEVSAFIIKLIKERDYSEEELVDCIFQEYEADREIIQRDLSAFIEKAKEIGFIE
jgi:HKD family nuclease